MSACFTCWGKMPADLCIRVGKSVRVSDAVSKVTCTKNWLAYGYRSLDMLY